MSFENHLYNVHVATIWAHPHVSNLYNQSVYLRLTIFVIVIVSKLLSRIKYMHAHKIYICYAFIYRLGWATNLNTNINKYNVDISPITGASTHLGLNFVVNHHVTGYKHACLRIGIGLNFGCTSVV